MHLVVPSGDADLPFSVSEAVVNFERKEMRRALHSAFGMAISALTAAIFRLKCGLVALELVCLYTNKITPQYDAAQLCHALINGRAPLFDHVSDHGGRAGDEGETDFIDKVSPYPKPT